MDTQPFFNGSTLMGNFVNSENTDKMPQKAAFHQDLQGLL